MRRAADRRGFSLVEVVLAVAVAAFVLTAIIGLLSVALSGSRSSGEETVLASLSTTIVSNLRHTAPTNAGASPVVTNLYFLADGRPLSASGTAAPSSAAEAAALGAIYQCRLSAQPDTNTFLPDGTAALQRLTLDFSWPVGAGATPNRRTLHASLLHR